MSELETDLNNMSRWRKPTSEKGHFKCSFLVTVNTFFFVVVLTCCNETLHSDSTAPIHLKTGRL